MRLLVRGRSLADLEEKARDVKVETEGAGRLVWEWSLEREALAREWSLEREELAREVGVQGVRDRLLEELDEE